MKKLVSFFDFWQIIASELGESRLKIVKTAHSIHELLDSDNGHKSYLVKAIKLSYKHSHCHHLKSPICINAVLDILGETAYTLEQQKQNDLLDIELLEEIAWLIGQRFSDQLDLDQQPDTRFIKRGEPAGQVISFPNAKIRRANTRV